MSLSSQCPQTPHFPRAEVTPRIPRPGILSPCPCAKQHWAQAAGFRKYLLCEVGQTASPHVIALTLTLMTSSGVPRTIFSFDNAQEKLTELTVSYYAHGYGFVCFLFFRERIPFRTNQRKRHTRQSCGASGYPLPWSHCPGIDVRQCIRGSLPEPWCPQFLLGLTFYCVADL